MHISLSDCTLRPFQEEDRGAAAEMGSWVIDWWHANGPGSSLHLVAIAGGAAELVGHLQVVDRGVPRPSRRPGQCHFTLHVAPQHRCCGIGGALYQQAEAFAWRRSAHLLYTSYLETEAAPAATFLQTRGFEPLERFLPSTLALRNFDPAPFHQVLERVQSQGIRLVTYAQERDTAENRHKLYHLEQRARSTQPFREVEPYIPQPFEIWEQGFTRRDPTAIFLAIAAAGQWVGVVTGLEWSFTGVDPSWRGQGIATALKIQALTEARNRGIPMIETENHADNTAMIAINRKLGFVFTTPEVACIKRLPCCSGRDDRVADSPGKDFSAGA